MVYKHLDVTFINRKSTRLGFLGPSMTVVQQSGTVDPSVGDAAGPNQHAVAGSAAEITPSSHGAVVFPFGTPQLQTQPKARRKVRRTDVTEEGHVVGAGEQDLHAHVEANLTFRPGRG